jgi:hypothetical protein
MALDGAVFAPRESRSWRTPLNRGGFMQGRHCVPMLAAAALIVAVAGCKKTGDGEYEVQKPVVGTVPETVHTPTVGMDSTEVVVPKVKVEKDTVTVKTPTVKNP